MINQNVKKKFTEDFIVWILIKVNGFVMKTKLIVQNTTELFDEKIYFELEENENLVLIVW